MQSSLESRVELFRRIPYFAGVPAERLRALAAHSPERRYQAGQVVFSQGHIAEGLYVVLSGRVTISVTSAAGREQILRAVGRGRVFGDIGAFSRTPCPGVARATATTSTALIPRVELERLFVQYPHAGLGALRLLAMRARMFTKLVADFSLRPVGARLAQLLLTLARGEPAIVEDGVSLVHRLTHAEIAALVGSVRAVVQRELKALERAGAIRLGRGRVEILEPGSLERLTSGDRVSFRAPDTV